jgi:WD40 repeat protein
MTQSRDDIGATMPSAGHDDTGATIPAIGAPPDSAQRHEAEQAVGFEWVPGDVILDLYEVKTVTEGYGEDLEEKPYHEGGFGRIYKVWHRAWQIEMAVKTPRADAFRSQQQKDAFTRECETWINLGLHPNVAACHYVRDLGGAPRVFSEYAEGGTLEDWIRTGRLYEREDQKAVLARILDIAIQFAWGLHYSHERGVIHQDVKPLNALMENDGTLKVTDFGLANAKAKAGVDASADGAGGSVLVSSGGMTPAYCSPEQQAGEKLDRRTDIWSWAVSVLEMFTGGVTWKSGTIAGHALASLMENGALDEDLPKMPVAVGEMLRGCFMMAKADRPESLLVCAGKLTEVYEKLMEHSFAREEPRALGDVADIINNRALSMLDLGRMDLAKKLFDEAIQFDKNHLAAHYNYGLIKWREGSISDADLLHTLRQQIKDPSANPDFCAAMGWVCAECGDFQQARNHWSSARGCYSLGVDEELINRVADNADRKLGGLLDTWHGGSKVVGVYQTDDSPGRDLRVGGHDDGSMSWYMLPSCHLIKKSSAHYDAIKTVQFSRDGKWVLTAGSDKVIKIWSAASRRCVRTFEGHTQPIEYAVFVDLSDRIESATFQETRSWDIAGVIHNSYLAPFMYCHPPQTDDLRSRQTRFRYLIEEAALTLSRLNVRRCLDLITKAAELDGYRNHSSIGEIKKSVALYCKRVGIMSMRLGDKLSAHAAPVNAAAFSPDGSMMVSGDKEGFLGLWKLSLRENILIGRAHNSAIQSIAWSWCGRYYASAGYDGHLKVWEAQNNRNIFSIHDSSGIASIAFQNGENRIYAGCTDGKIIAWNYSRATRESELLGHNGAVWSVATTFNGRFLLSGGQDAVVRLWDLSKGALISEMRGHMLSIHSVSLPADCSLAISVGEDGEARIWGLSDMKCVFNIQETKGKLRAIAPSLCGSYLFSWSSGSPDGGTLTCWKLATMEPIATLPVRDIGNTWLKVSPDASVCILPGSRSGIALLDLDWRLEFPGWMEWDEGANAYVTAFHQCTRGTCTDDQQKMLQSLLQHAGYGWIRPENVIKRLKEIAG